jgi:hypothetical protein
VASSCLTCSLAPRGAHEQSGAGLAASWPTKSFAIKGATVPFCPPFFHLHRHFPLPELLRPETLKPSAPPPVVEPLLSGEPPQEHAAELARSPPPGSASSSTLERRTPSSTTSALAASAALLDKLRRIPRPSDPVDLRRRPLVSSFALIHFLPFQHCSSVR